MKCEDICLNFEPKEHNSASTPASIEERVALLEHKFDTICTEIFMASEGSIGANIDQCRTTLKGTVDKLCYDHGIPPVSSPWSNKKMSVGDVTK